MNERQHKKECSTLFFFLPSITDFKEKINQFRDKISFNLIDCCLEFLYSFSPDKKVHFQSHLLNSTDIEKRGPQVELLHNFSRHMAETSNANFIRNTNHLLASSTEKRDNNKTAWVGPTKQRYEITKFKLIY